MLYEKIHVNNIAMVYFLLKTAVPQTHSLKSLVFLTSRNQSDQRVIVNQWISELSE